MMVIALLEQDPKKEGEEEVSPEYPPTSLYEQPVVLTSTRPDIAEKNNDVYMEKYGVSANRTSAAEM